MNISNRLNSVIIDETNNASALRYRPYSKRKFVNNVVSLINDYNQDLSADFLRELLNPYLENRFKEILKNKSFNDGPTSLGVNEIFNITNKEVEVFGDRVAYMKIMFSIFENWFPSAQNSSIEEQEKYNSAFKNYINDFKTGMAEYIRENQSIIVDDKEKDEEILENIVSYSSTSYLTQSLSLSNGRISTKGSSYTSLDAVARSQIEDMKLDYNSQKRSKERNKRNNTILPIPKVKIR